jgi:hypothetical protein
MNLKEKLVLMCGLGLVLGLFPAWIARQWYQTLLFGGLGAASVILEKKFAHVRPPRFFLCLAGASRAAGRLSGLPLARWLSLFAGVVVCLSVCCSTSP